MNISFENVLNKLKNNGTVRFLIKHKTVLSFIFLILIPTAYVYYDHIVQPAATKEDMEKLHNDLEKISPNYTKMPFTTNESLVMFIPQYGNGYEWHTVVYVRDFSGLGSNLTLKYYSPDGTLAVIESRSVPANRTYTWIPSDGSNGRPTTGSLQIISDRKVEGGLNIYSLSNTNVVSNKLLRDADIGTNFTLPWYGDHLERETWMVLSDASSLGANITIKYYYLNNTLAKIETQPISANGMYIFTPSNGANGRPTTGKLNISSDNKISGDVRIYYINGSGITSTKLQPYT